MCFELYLLNRDQIHKLEKQLKPIFTTHTGYQIIKLSPPPVYRLLNQVIAGNYLSLIVERK